MISRTHVHAFCTDQFFLRNRLRARPLTELLICRRRQTLQSPKRQARSMLRASLDPPNEEVDWVYVDITSKSISAIENAERLEAEVHDDAKSLVRVALRDKAAELSVVLCSDEDIHSMNSKWRGLDESTDVLSFPQDDPDQVILGDIVVSFETAARQARERGHTLRDEIRILLVHGLLHLLGYDHEGAIEGDWLVMAQMENRFMKQLEWVGEGLVSAAQDPTYRDIIQS